MKPVRLLLVLLGLFLAVAGCGRMLAMFLSDDLTPVPPPSATTQRATDPPPGDKTPPESDVPLAKGSRAGEEDEGGIAGFLDGLGGLAMTLLGGVGAGAAYRTIRPAKRIKAALARITGIAVDLVQSVEMVKLDAKKTTVKEPGRGGKVVDLRKKVVAALAGQEAATEEFVKLTKAKLRG